MRGGKQAPWYIVSRMTWHEKFDNIRLGDRLMALWQGQGFYHFATLDKPSGNPNVVANTPYGDIEGVWTFVYMSYSLPKTTAVNIIRYDGVNQVEHRELRVNHGLVEYLKVVIGKDPWHPAFNGQIANIAIKFGPGAFVDKFDFWKRHLDNRIPHPPADDNKL